MRPRPTLRQAAALASAAAFVAAAFSCAAAEEAREGLYRKGTPPVLKPAGDAEDDARRTEASAARDAFRRAYRRAGSPRLAVFWNRVFDDRLREMEAGSRLVIEGKRDARIEEAGKTSIERDSGEWTVSLETPRDGARPWPLSEVAGFKFQTGFLAPLIESGAAVIDRAAVMRLTAARRALAVDPEASGSAGAIEDRQLVETAALMEHADLLIQIALSPSDESPTGAFFHVSIIDVETGRVRATFFNDAMSGDKEKKWVAAPGGYVQVEEDRGAMSGDRGKKWAAAPGGYVQVEEDRGVDLERTGRVLAAQAMDALTRMFAPGKEEA